MTWTSPAATLPDESINVIREDRKNPDLLFVGTDRAVYASLNGGNYWMKMRNNMPAVAVHDLIIHPRDGDLVVGTHGRGFFIADISPLQEMTDEVMNHDAFLFRIEPRVLVEQYNVRATSSQNFRGESESRGIPINYYLGSDAADVKIEVYAGVRLIKTLEGEAGAGLNQVRWDMSGDRPLGPGEARGGQRGRGGGGQPPQRGGQFGQRGGQQRGDPNVTSSPMPPGEYRVVLTVGNLKFERTASIWSDRWFK